ncbi:MAG: LysR family transcriptional regulator [Verrucomicrobiota bacterium]
MHHDLLDARRLEIFTHVVDKHNFTAAAKKVGLTQSAVSHAIKALEEDLGCRLIDRIGKRAQPTEAGQELYDMAQNVLSEMSNIRHQVGKDTIWKQKTLRVGATNSICQYLLPSVIREFKESFPECKIYVISADSPKLMEQLMQNELDIAISLQLPGEVTYNFRPLFEDRLYYLVSSMHPWATRTPTTDKEITEENFILYSNQSHTYRMILNYFQRRNIELQSNYQVGSLEVIKELVKVGVGVSVGSHWICEQERQERSIALVSMGKKLTRSWGLMTRNQRKLSLVEETFMGLCQLAAENLPSDEAVEQKPKSPTAH